MEVEIIIQTCVFFFCDYNAVTERKKNIDLTHMWLGGCPNPRLYILGWVTGAFSMDLRLILWRFSKIDCH